MFVNILLLLSIFLAVGEPKTYARMTSVKCEASLKSVENLYCFIKAYVRKYTTLNSGFKLLRTITDGKVSCRTFVSFNNLVITFQLNYSVEHKRGTDQYATVLKLKDLPTCELVKGTDNPIVKNILQLIKAYAGQFLEICSRQGEFKVANMSLVNSSFIVLWPAGDYKISFKLFDSLDDNIVSLSYTTTLSH